MRLYTILILLLSLLAACGPAQESKTEASGDAPAPFLVSSGTAKRIEAFPSDYIGERQVDIWLPASYDGKTPHAVLYMHDGAMLFDTTHTWNHQEWQIDEILGRLIAENKIRPTLVVGIYNDGPGRHTEYFPQKPFYQLPVDYRDSILALIEADTALADRPEPLRADRYLNFLTRELKPWIDSAFVTAADRDNTFISGASMGGLISWYAICEYPEVFGGAACISTHFEGFYPHPNNPNPLAFQNYFRDNMPDPATHKLYFGFGTETLDATYAPYHAMMDSTMAKAGYTAANQQTRMFEGDDHSEASWQRRFHIPAEFLLKKEKN